MARPSCSMFEKVLAPALEPGDIVIMDNLGSHRAKAVRAAMRAAGARLFFLPKYSPDLNPIEMFFAKLKHCCERRHGAPARPSTTPSPPFFQTSHHMNAPTSLPTPDMGADKIIPL